MDTGPSTNASKLRVLACVLCQQRKVKCNRVFPCQTCLKAGVQCIPANLIPPKPRRRRFAEKELLDRIRRYEGLMRENNIDFESLHPAFNKEPNTKTGALSTEAIDLWQALQRATLDEDSDFGDDIDHTTTADPAVINESYSQRFRGNGLDHMQDHLLFGPVLVDSLVHFHPDPSNIFRLWQIYLDNVNPLLKITHTPTLQPRIINAMRDLDQLDPTFELLLFSIYSIAIVSLDNEQCLQIFQTSQDDLLLRFQTACQQALHKCNIWKSASDEALAAFFLFLISLRTVTDVRSLSCMLAVLIRMAQRNGHHIKAASDKHTMLEAELRRRLWWSLVQYDNRVCELCNYTSSMMTPTWDCPVPYNLNDFELRTETRTMPEGSLKMSEASFVVLRARLADFMRHSTPHLSFTNPSLSSIAQARHTGGLNSIEETQEGVFETCDINDPLHCMTTWTLRGSIAKLRLLEYYATFTTTSKPPDTERSTAMASAIKMLIDDAMIRRSTLTKGFIWYATFNFPALAYHHILNTLCKRPGEHFAKQGWQAMEDHYSTFSAQMTQPGTKRGVAHFFVYTSKLVLEAWRVRRAYLVQQALPSEPIPRFIEDMQAMANGDTTTPSIAGTISTQGTARSPTTAEDDNELKMTQPCVDLTDVITDQWQSTLLQQSTLEELEAQWSLIDSNTITDDIATDNVKWLDTELQLTDLQSWS